MGRTLSLGAIAVAIAALSSAAWGQSHDPASACVAPGARLIDSSPQATVFATRVPRAGTEIRACLKGARRPLTLGQQYGCAEFTCSGVRRAALGGAVVAYERASWHSQLGSTHRVVVVDLRGRRRLQTIATGPLSPAQRHPAGRPDEVNDGIGPVMALGVHPTGAVAWVVKDFCSRRPGTSYQVHRADVTGRVRLAHGPDIVPASLRVAGRRVSWVQGRERHSAALGYAA